MRIKTLNCTQFRSYASLQFNTGTSDIHVLFGPNGAGKTNVLEAINILALSRSFLGIEDSELLRWNEEWYTVAAEAELQDGETFSLEVAYQIAPQKKKVFRHNGADITAKELVGLMPTVTFLPEDLELFTGSPQNRRSYLDRILCQVSPVYLQTLSQYQHVVKQRNVLLKTLQQGNGSTEDLAVWDEQLAELGTAITLERLELLELWQLSIEAELQQLGEDFTNCSLQYARKTTATEAVALKEECREALSANYSRDIALASTSIGPHRDDWNLYVNERKITSFASRGQQRTAVVALLFLETSYLELKRNERPIVLLDDVFSELDDGHQTALRNAMANTQVFITTAHTPPNWPEATYWHVQNGAIAPLELPNQ